VITVGIGLDRLVSKVKSWRFSRQLAKAERRHESTQIIANNVETNWNVGMMALIGAWNHSKLTHKDWMK
jgi:hypothetical protein